MRFRSPNVRLLCAAIFKRLPKVPDDERFAMSLRPESAREARTALLPAERNLPIEESEFPQRYGLQEVVQPCLAAMMRKTYGEDCPQMAARFGVESASYCL